MRLVRAQIEQIIYDVTIVGGDLSNDKARLLIGKYEEEIQELKQEIEWLRYDLEEERTWSEEE